MSLTVTEFSSSYPDLTAQLVLWPIYYVLMVAAPLVSLWAKAKSNLHPIAKWNGLLWNIGLMVLGVAVAIGIPMGLFLSQYRYLPSEDGSVKEEGMTLGEFMDVYPKASTA